MSSIQVNCVDMFKEPFKGTWKRDRLPSIGLAGHFPQFFELLECGLIPGVVDPLSRDPWSVTDLSIPFPCEKWSVLSKGDALCH